jgi:hypothetical protein
VGVVGWIGWVGTAVATSTLWENEGKEDNSQNDTTTTTTTAPRLAFRTLVCKYIIQTHITINII